MFGDLSGHAKNVGDGASVALKDIRELDIEQGPALLRILAFFAGLGSFGTAIYMMINPMAAVFHPIMYMMYTYIALFAATTMLFEAKNEWIAKVSILDKYQNILITRCSFLTVMGGRGLWYIFQATLWLFFAHGFAALSDLIKIGAAGVLGFVGILHLLAHWDIMPHQVAKKAMAMGQKAVKAAEPLIGKDIDKDGKIGA